MSNEATAGVLNFERDSDSDSFESIFEQNYKRVYNVLYRLTGHQMEAEDLTVETFMRYLQKRPARLDQHAGWLYRVAVRLGMNSLRASRRRNSYEQKAGSLIAGGNISVDPAQQALRVQQQNKVRETLRGMSKRDAEILVLHHSGFSYKEIAEAVGVSPASVGTLLSRAHKDFERRYVGGN